MEKISRSHVGIITKDKNSHAIKRSIIEAYFEQPKLAKLTFLCLTNQIKNDKIYTFLSTERMWLMKIDREYKVSAFGDFSDIVPTPDNMMLLLQEFKDFGMTTF